MSEVTYDAEADALYICVQQAGHSSSRVRTVGNPDGSVLVDTWDGVLHGIEILGASRHPIFSALLPRISGGTLTGFTLRDSTEAPHE